ncbi:hypothetical protein DXG03_009754 [Asterophora parasitica]|uniref:Carbohydrate-binding module family 19 domain-containing protein n=1 Tax=Asterophora parasitica TaxID=117018 RepID=A0A9P7GAH7_9AGAR|nr:hypothetical protein DXG03_009754 [Asterophora parasitica]
MLSSSITTFTLLVTMAMLALAAPTLDATTLLRSGQEAQRLNVAFQNMKASDVCTNGEKACMSGGIAACRDGAWAVPQGLCSKTQDCFALPSVQTAGTDVMCTSEKNALLAIEATGAIGGIFGNSTAPAGGSPENSKEHEDTKASCYEQDAECPTESNNDTPVSTPSHSPTPKPTAVSTVIVTKTVTQLSSPVTSSQVEVTHTVTVHPPVTTTITLSDKPVTLSPTTRTISPEEASSMLSKFFEGSATILEVSTASVTPSSVEATFTTLSSPGSPPNTISLTVAPTSPPAAA